MISKSPNNGGDEELYLRGLNYYSGKEIDWSEKVSYGGTDNQRKWDFNVFGTGTVRIDEQDGALHGGHGAEEFNCIEKDVFGITQYTYEPGSGGSGQWVKGASEIKFKLTNCDMAGGRRKCDIEIASVKNLLITKN